MANSKVKEKRGFKDLIGSLFETIGAIFKPVLIVIIGAGILQALRDVLLMAGVIERVSSSYIFLDGMGSAVFHFLPIFLAISSAQVFGATPFLAAAVAGFLVYPDVVNLFDWASEVGWDLTIFGVIPVTHANYPSSVLPIILIVWFQSKIEPVIQKIVPDLIKSIFFPVLTIFITSFVALVVLGPIGTWMGDLIAAGINWLNQRASWLVPTVVGAISPFLVMTGSHYSLFPVATQNLAQLGYDTVLLPGMLASNMALAGASFAIATKSKNKMYKSYSASSGLTSLFGISQSSLYGNAIPLKKPLVAAVIGGGVAGFYAGITGIRASSFATPGILSIVSYLTPMSNLINVIITMIIALVVTYVLTLVMGFEDPDEETVRALTGEAMSEEELEDREKEAEKAREEERIAAQEAAEADYEKMRSSATLSKEEQEKRKEEARLAEEKERQAANISRDAKHQRDRAQTIRGATELGEATGLSGKDQDKEKEDA